MSNQALFWIVFNAFVLLMLFLDLAVFNRKAHVVTLKESLGWVAVWVSLALLFGVGIYFWYPGMGGHPGHKVAALSFITGYLIEESLSMDNLFVFLMVFRYFRVPAEYQHKVLFWGIIGALVMRAIFIFAGVALINRFHWLIYVFGAFLVYTGIKMFTHDDDEVHPERNPVLKLFRRFVPVTSNYVEGKFWTIVEGRRFATPLAVVLIVVETTDVLFAADSIPAILAISTDPFIVYTSNVFAIMGLRSLYFALAGMMDIFHYLNYGLSTILIFIGLKMLLSSYIKIPIGIALGVVAATLIISIVVSLMHKPAAKETSQ
jgi:tellurite resistance protein TerC